MNENRRDMLQREWPGVLQYARAVAREDHRAYDLAQEFAVRVLTAKQVPDNRSAFRRWLFKSLRNLAIDEWRRTKNALQAVEDDYVEPDCNVWRYDDRAIAKITVGQALLQLSEDMREIVVLVDLVGFSYAEAAEILDVPKGTVMSRLSRARAILLAFVEDGTVRVLANRRVN